MKCTALLPCERVIIDKEGSHSIINVMLTAGISLQVTAAESDGPKDTDIPTNAIAPLVWWIYTVWHPSTDDVGKNFEQHFRVFWPNDETFFESKMSFLIANMEAMQTTFHVGGLPAGQTGAVKIITWVERDGEKCTPASEAYIDIVHRKPPNTILPRIAYQFTQT